MMRRIYLNLDDGKGGDGSNQEDYHHEVLELLEQHHLHNSITSRKISVIIGE